MRKIFLLLIIILVFFTLSCHNIVLFVPTECKNTSSFKNKFDTCNFVFEKKGVDIKLFANVDIVYYELYMKVSTTESDTIICTPGKLNIGSDTLIYKIMDYTADFNYVDSLEKIIILPGDTVKFIWFAYDIYPAETGSPLLEPKSFWANLGEIITYGDSGKLLNDTIYFIPQE